MLFGAGTKYKTGKIVVPSETDDFDVSLALPDMFSEIPSGKSVFISTDDAVGVKFNSISEPLYPLGASDITPFVLNGITNIFLTTGIGKTPEVKILLFG